MCYGCASIFSKWHAMPHWELWWSKCHSPTSSTKNARVILSLQFSEFLFSLGRFYPPAACVRNSCKCAHNDAQVCAFNKKLPFWCPENPIFLSITRAGFDHLSWVILDPAPLNWEQYIVQYGNTTQERFYPWCVSTTREQFFSMSGSAEWTGLDPV